jgi:hypothetical protein
MLWEVAAQWAPSGTPSSLNSSTVGSISYAQFSQQLQNGFRQVRPVPFLTAAQWALSGTNTFPNSCTVGLSGRNTYIYICTLGSAKYAQFPQQLHRGLC